MLLEKLIFNKYVVYNISLFNPQEVIESCPANSNFLIAIPLFDPQLEIQDVRHWVAKRLENQSLCQRINLFDLILIDTWDVFVKLSEEFFR